MIIVNLAGGLGNQMFQYAAGYALSIKHKTELKLDIQNLPNGFPPRNYELSIFGITGPFATNKEIKKLTPPTNFLTGKSPRLTRWLAAHTPTYVNERFIDGKIPDLSNVFLDGNWQSEDYFKAQAKEIRACFKFKKTRTHFDPASVSIHVRRTDYVERHGRAKIIGCSLGYYKKAMTLIIKKIKQPVFYVFSDDIDWCGKNIFFPGFKFHYSSSPDDLRLMTLCKHNIVANSSFSWWGAWLNQNPNKIVVAPDPWFNTTETWRREIVPNSWIKIQKTL